MRQTPPATQSRTWFEWSILIVILLLAAVLRLGYPGTNPYSGDEARLSVLALQTIHGESFATYGISSSSGARNPPASVYAFLPPYIISSDPLVATLYVGVLNVLAVGLTWLLVRKKWGFWPALIAALYLSTAPYAVFFSRNIWTQNLLIPIGAAWLFAAFMSLTVPGARQRQIAIVSTIFLAGIASQIHVAGVVLFPALLYTAIRGRWWRYPVSVIAGAVLALIPLLPFLWQAACCAPELIQEYADTLGSEPGRVDLQALGHLLRLTANYGWDYLALGDLGTVGESIPLAGITVLIVTLGILAMLWYRRRERNAVLVELILVQIAAPLLVFTYHSSPVRLHYMLPALPAIAIAAGASVLLLRTRMRIFTMTIMALIAFAWTFQGLFSLNTASDRITSNGIGAPLSVPRQVAQSIPDNGRVVMHTQSADIVSRAEPAMWHNLLWDRPHNIVDGWSILLLPNEPAYLMTEIDGIHAWQEMRDAGLMTSLQTYKPIPDASPYYSQFYDGEADPEGFQWLNEPLPFESGLTLLAWKARQVDHQLRLSALWQITDQTGESVQQFAHLLPADNPQGEPVAFGDLPLAFTPWQTGDRLISIAVFVPSVAGEYVVRLGHYQLTNGQRYLTQTGSDSFVTKEFEWRNEPNPTKAS